MELSLIDKLGVIFNYLFSSFLSLEIFILNLLLLIILIVNIKKKNLYISLSAIGVYVGFIIGIFISYTDYVSQCIDTFVKGVMNYIYFPSPIAYFFIMVFVVIVILVTLFSNKMTAFKKIFNYCNFSLMFFFFISFMSIVAYQNVDFTDFLVLYQNDVILSIIQISNFILFFWIIFTAFYYLYKMFKRKFEKKD